MFWGKTLRPTSTRTQKFWLLNSVWRIHAVNVVKSKIINSHYSYITRDKSQYSIEVLAYFGRELSIRCTCFGEHGGLGRRTFAFKQRVNQMYRNIFRESFCILFFFLVSLLLLVLLLYGALTLNVIYVRRILRYDVCKQKTLISI